MPMECFRLPPGPGAVPLDSLVSTTKSLEILIQVPLSFFSFKC